MEFFARGVSVVCLLPTLISGMLMRGRFRASDINPSAKKAAKPVTLGDSTVRCDNVSLAEFGRRSHSRKS
jgi:hypothetical protein